MSRSRRSVVTLRGRDGKRPAAVRPMVGTRITPRACKRRAMYLVNMPRGPLTTCIIRTPSRGDIMTIKSFLALAVLMPLAVSTSTIAQPQQTNSSQEINSAQQANPAQPTASAPSAAPTQPTAPASSPAPAQPTAPAPPSGSQPQAAQTQPQHWNQEELDSYGKHNDTRHGHDRVYPDRGAVIRSVPHGATVVNYAGVTYRFFEGVWFEPRGPAFIVVAPPIGLIVPSVPAYATPVANGAETYLYANEAYYRARPELGGYEVVNDPVVAAPSTGSGIATAAVTSGPPIHMSQATAPVAPPPVPVAMATVAAPAAIPTVAPAAASAATIATPVPVVVPAVLSTVAVATPSLPVAPATVPAGAAPTPTPPVAPAAAPAAAAPTAIPVPAAPAAPAVAFARPSTVASSGPTPGIFPATYARNGQTPDEQARDHYDCYRFAAVQTGFDPMRPNGGVAPSQTAEAQLAYERAQKACFEARGYVIR